MDHFTRHDLRHLSKVTGNPVVSIYVPTYRAGREVRQNATRFKNMIREASRHIAATGTDDRCAKSPLLAVASKLENDDDWWQHQSDGLAMFLADDRFDRYRLPVRFDEFLSVGPRCHVRPLVRLLQHDGRFYLLAVSQNRVRLLEGTRYSIDELEVEQLPSDLQSALNIDEYTSTLQQHSTGGADVAGSTMFHGQGAAGMDVHKKDEISQYFHRINAALTSFLDDDRIPLIFAGVDYLFPLYRETCRHKGLVDKPLTGNPDERTAEELHEETWPIIEARFSRNRNAALSQYNDLAATEKATNDLGKVIRAARQGAVGTLLLAAGEQRWGVIDEQKGTCTATDAEADGAEDLLNYAAVHTLTSAGSVYSLPSNTMPNGQASAAILRFPIP